MTFVWIYVTTASREEAVAIARTLVAERLAAGVNLLDGVQSVYRWDGEVREAAETVLIAKTRGDLVDAVTARVSALHSYDCPCIVALPISGGNAAYFDWIGRETR